MDVLFSVYLGWITVATVANITDWLYFVEWDGFGIPAQTWAVIMLAVASLLGLAMALTRRDVGYLVCFGLGVHRDCSEANVCADGRRQCVDCGCVHAGACYLQPDAPQEPSDIIHKPLSLWIRTQLVGLCPFSLKSSRKGDFLAIIWYAKHYLALSYSCLLAARPNRCRCLHLL